MTKKKQVHELDKSERIKKHERTHKTETNKNDGQLGRLEPKHKPSKKNHTNILDAYEKFGEDYDDFKG